MNTRKKSRQRLRSTLKPNQLQLQAKNQERKKEKKNTPIFIVHIQSMLFARPCRINLLNLLPLLASSYRRRRPTNTASRPFSFSQSIVTPVDMIPWPLAAWWNKLSSARVHSAASGTTSSLAWMLLANGCLDLLATSTPSKRAPAPPRNSATPSDL